MLPARHLVVITVFLVMLSGPRAASGGESTVTFDWMGAEVSIISPDDAAYGLPFSISFSIDLSPLPPGDTFAFKTFLETTNTIDASSATWEYTFISDDPGLNFTLTGTLGDAITPTTHDPSGYSIRLFDPYLFDPDTFDGEYTWLQSEFNDHVVWTLHDLVLLADADFTLTLEAFLMAPEDFESVVVPGPVPEPSTVSLLCMGLCWIAAARRKSLRAANRSL